jgi:hypothetical protein
MLHAARCAPRRWPCSGGRGVALSKARPRGPRRGQRSRIGSGVGVLAVAACGGEREYVALAVGEGRPWSRRGGSLRWRRTVVGSPPATRARALVGLAAAANACSRRGDRRVADAPGFQWLGDGGSCVCRGASGGRGERAERDVVVMLRVARRTKRGWRGCPPRSWCASECSEVDEPPSAEHGRVTLRSARRVWGARPSSC